MADDLFFQALAQQPPRILRRKRPYSLGHSCILDAVGSPFATGGIPLPGDILFLLMVCGMRFDQACQCCFAHDAPRFPGIGKLSLYLRLAGIGPTLDAIDGYLGEYKQSPKVWSPTDSKGKPFGAPWQVHVMRVLCSVYRYTESEAWNTSVTKAMCLYYVDAEARGRLDIKSDADENLIDYAKRIRQAVADGDMELARKLEQEAQHQADIRRGKASA